MYRFLLSRCDTVVVILWVGLNPDVLPPDLQTESSWTSVVPVTCSPSHQVCDGAGPRGLKLEKGSICGLADLLKPNSFQSVSLNGSSWFWCVKQANVIKCEYFTAYYYYYCCCLSLIIIIISGHCFGRSIASVSRVWTDLSARRLKVKRVCECDEVRTFGFSLCVFHVPVRLLLIAPPPPQTVQSHSE